MDELLKEILGENYEAVIAAAKAKGASLLVNDNKEPAFFPKERYDQMLEHKKSLETKVAGHEAEIETLKKDSGASEELKAKLTELQTQNADWQAKYQESRLDSALKLAGLQANVQDPDVFKMVVDRTKLKLNDDGSVIGLEEQLTALKESKAYLFKTDVPPTTTNQPGNPTKVPPKTGKFTMDQIKAMTPEEINANWAEVSQVL